MHSLPNIKKHPPCVYFCVYSVFRWSNIVQKKCCLKMGFKKIKGGGKHIGVGVTIDGGV